MTMTPISTENATVAAKQNLLSVAEAAAELGVSERRVRQFIAEGRLKATRFGHIWAIHRAALRAVADRPGPGRPRGRQRRRRPRR